MTIKLVGSSSGSVSLQAPASTTGGANRVLTLPDADGTVAVGDTGKTLQVLQAVKTDTFSLDGTATADITGLSQAITPSSSSNKILISYSVNFSIRYDGYGGGLKLVRGSTQIYLGDAAGSRVRSSNGFFSGPNSNQHHIWTGQFLDSPNTTSETTYKLQLFSGGSGRTTFINRSFNDQDSSVNSFRTVSQITVMEIAA